MKYIFFFEEHEVERSFKDGTDYSDVESVFDTWLFECHGVGGDESDDYIELGDAGFYEIENR